MTRGKTSWSKNSPLIKGHCVAVVLNLFMSTAGELFYFFYFFFVMALILLHVTAPLHLNSLLGLVPKKRRRKTPSFLFTSLLVAIKINDSGLCDNEIPPSLLTTGVTYLPMSRWLQHAWDWLMLTLMESCMRCSWRNQTLTDANNC